MSRSRVPGPFRLTVDPIIEAVTSSRRSFERWLTGVGITGGTRDELAVVFSELVSNATRGSAGTGGVSRVDAWTDAQGMVLEVSNAVPSDAPPVEHWSFGDPLRSNGRGLMIVRAYTDDLSITAADGRITVRCRRLLD